MRISQYLVAMTGLSCGVGSANKMMRKDAVCEQISLHGRYSPSLIDVEIKQWYAANRSFLLLSACIAAIAGIALLSIASSAWWAALGAIWMFTGVRAIISLIAENRSTC